MVGNAGNGGERGNSGERWNAGMLEWLVEPLKMLG